MTDSIPTVTIPLDLALAIKKLLPPKDELTTDGEGLSIYRTIDRFTGLIPKDRPLPPTTRGPYRIGRFGSCIVADHPVDGMRGSDEINFYGGHMVAESIAPQNAPLLAASWDMLEALERIAAIASDYGAEQRMDPEDVADILETARAARARARGEDRT